MEYNSNLRSRKFLYVAYSVSTHTPLIYLNYLYVHKNMQCLGHKILWLTMKIIIYNGILSLHNNYINIIYINIIFIGLVWTIGNAVAAPPAITTVGPHKVKKKKAKQEPFTGQVKPNCVFTLLFSLFSRLSSGVWEREKREGIFMCVCVCHAWR